MNRTHRLISPAVVGSVALLALNDHVLKPRWPGLLTGKLSDIAGLFALAVAAAVFVGPERRRGATLALAGTGVAFAAVKLAPGIAALVAPVLGGPIVTDPTDLLALAVLPLSHRFVRSQRTPTETVRSQRTPTETVRSQRTPTETVRSQRIVGAQGVRSRRAPARPAGSLQVLAATLAVTAGTFSVTATSCLEAEQVTGFALVPDGVVAGVGGPGGPTTEYLSTDGGRTWAIYDPAAPEAGPGANTRAGTGPTLVTQTQICLNDTGCYRVADQNRVEQRDDDGQWHTAYTFTDEQIRRMRLRADRCSGRGEPEQMFASLTPTGPTSPSDRNPPTVLVAMGSQGLLRLDPDTGRWDRLAVGPAEPLGLRGPSWLADLSRLPLLFLLITPALYLVNRKRRPRRQRIVLTIAATAVAAAIGLATRGVLVVTFGSVDYAVFGTSVAALSIAAFLISLAAALRPPRGDDVTAR